mmetsp:Transcript_48550/g.75811  ORF Transcript_48550/g.75811 Transcript_48550/m.75811 type:complete len:384 (+) Transcript_48550:41-1192(+)|eukprot:CAMPEP_0184290468 /NCGR_PEP_ID=MMETSP1049-20130417/2704_1 /TAXON_ID=77928 /ORGANISM="Proteomonas sulcata, Strain CCMP704" /LENGTH=383 /DNA_ID=CAMNT_0026597627 /DNA_START=29 /DNA_END=1180 /DNA_ORIENTATION=-
MVKAEFLPLSSGARPRSSNQDKFLQIAAVCAVACLACVFVISAGSSSDAVELEGRQLTAEEKRFVETSTSTPNRDLASTAKKVGSDGGMHDMDSFYDHMQKQIKKVNKAHTGRKNTLPKYTATTAKTRINGYFDKLAKQVKVEHKQLAKKESGTGAAARKEMDSYFASIDNQQKEQVKKDQARLRAEAKWHSKHGSAVQAMSDINSYFDKLQTQTHQQTLAHLKKEHKKASYDFVTPEAAKHKGGEAVHVHKHDEEGIQESDKESRDDINSYFDNLDKKQSDVNEKDKKHLAKAETYGSDHTKLTTSGSQDDLDSYFNKMHTVYAHKDAADRAALRKDNNPVNFKDGVNVAQHPKHPSPLASKKAALKAHAASKRAKEQAAAH